VSGWSGGMKRRLDLAAAFVEHPAILLLDEPTTGLDPRSKKDVQHFVNRLRDEHDATMADHPGELLNHGRPKKVQIGIVLGRQDHSGVHGRVH
jgi:energy-coupling factor transporter ATP-binding protein EcfA2